MVLFGGLQLTSVSAVVKPKINKKQSKQQLKFVDKNLFQSGTIETIKQNINGDFYCFAETCIIDKQVNGDVFAMARTVKISSKIDGSVRTISRDLVLEEKAEIRRNLTSVTQFANLKQGSKIGYDVYIIGSDIDLYSFVNRGLAAGSENIKIFGQVNGDLHIESERIYLGQNAKIGGNAKLSANDFDIKDEKVIKGKISKINLTEKRKKQNKKFQEMFGTDTIQQKIGRFLFAFLANLALLTIILVIKPKTLTKIAKQKMKSFDYLKVFSLGLTAIILIPVVLVLSLFGLVFYKLTIIIAFLYIIMLILSKTVFIYVLTQQKIGIKNKVKLKPYHFAVVLLVFQILNQIPFIGGIVGMVGYGIGFGILIKTLFRFNK